MENLLENWRTFTHFPEDKKCVLCGMSTDKPCVLIPIARTTDGNICQATPVHAECIDPKNMIYDPYVGVVYLKAMFDQAACYKSSKES